jgi:CBS domain-containing protein
MATSFSVRDFMTRDLVTFTPDMDVLEASRILAQRRISGAPVVDRLGNLVGILSEKDCLEVVLSATYYEEWGGRVAEYMHTDVKTVDADEGIAAVARRFLEEGYRRFPVLDENRLVGQISRRDVLCALERLRHEPRP